MPCSIIIICLLQYFFLTKCQSNESVENSQKLTFSSSQSEEQVDVFGQSTETKVDQPIIQLPQGSEFAAELKGGDPADVFGTNQHFSYPTKYKDLGRRFVPQYPYKEMKYANEVVAEAELDKIVKNTKALKFKADDMKLVPVKASPELVLNVAMESAIYEANQPNKPQLNEKDILRSGDYWNGIWKEDIDPKVLLRSLKKNKSNDKQNGQIPNLGSVRAKIMPGSKLYQLISLLKQVSPRFLYVINSQD